MIALLLSLQLVAEAPPPLKIAVYDIDGQSADPIFARVVTDAVVAELRKLEGLNVIGMDEVRAMLDHEAQKQLVGCSDDSCIAEIAEGLGVDGIVIGTLATVGDGTVFGLKRIDQRQATTLGQYTQRLTGASGEECLAAVGPAVEKLFPERALLPGQSRGVAPELSLRLNPPPLDPIVVYAGAGLTGVGVLIAGGALAVNLLSFDAARAATEASRTGPAIDGKDLRSNIEAVRASFWVGVGAAAGAALAGAGTGVAALFTDWAGYREMNEQLATKATPGAE